MVQTTIRSSIRTLLLPVLFFAVLTAVTARIVVPLPFTPVPITLQVLAVLLSGLVLGSRAGATSQLVYLAAIVVGAPLTASGASGPAVFLSPTAGYLVAFVPAAFVTGWMVEDFQKDGGLGTLINFAASLCGMLVIYAGGVTWLAFLLGDLQVALHQGLLPFIAVDLGKVVAAALVASSGRRLFLPFTVA